MRACLLACVVGMTMGAPLAWAQSGSVASEGAALSNGGVIHTLVAEPVTGEPYSAMQVHTTVRRLEDGTKASRQGHHFVARDSAGRVRVEIRTAKGQGGQPDSAMVFVSDPVAHTLTTWSTAPQAKHVATVIKLSGERKTLQPAVRSMREDPSLPQPTVTTENLGTQMLDGLAVTDVKTTTVVPAGRSGYDTPITKTREMWTSDEMKLVMKEEWTDPRSGVRTVELRQFSRVEPDAALFHAPKGYEVKDVKQTLREIAQKLNEAADSQ